MRAPLVAIVVALLALGCGARGTGEYRALEETRLADAGLGDPGSAAGGASPGLAEAIARWEAGGGKVAPGAEEKACLGPAPERALGGTEMERIFAAAFAGLLGAPRFVAARVASGLWPGELLKANVADVEAGADGEGARKIWLAEGAVERRLAYTAGGRPRQLVLRSSVANPLLVVSGGAAAQRDVVVLEVGARFAVGDGERIALVDRGPRLAAVLALAEGEWRFVRFVDLKGVDDSRAALCRAIAVP